MFRDDPPLAGEDAVVWLEEVERLDYVREMICVEPFRRRRPAWRGEGAMVGYTTLRPDARRSDEAGFTRRVFWLRDTDRCRPLPGPYDEGGAPVEGVDPRTVGAGIWGRATDRTWGSE